MTKECFQKLCSDIINPYIDELISLDKEYGSNCLVFKKNSINRIYENYESKRRVVRKYFMHLQEKPMDRHKIGSVFMYAILKSRVFKVTKLARQPIPRELVMANEYLAVLVALSVIESYRKDDYREKFGTDHDSRDVQLKLPMTFHNESPDAYIDNLCKSLYYVNDYSKFDIFAYANILFLLEVYTDTYNDK